MEKVMNRRRFLKTTLIVGVGLVALKLKEPGHVLAAPWKPPKDRKKVTPKDRKAAALNAQAMGVSSPTALVTMNGMVVPDYFGNVPNFANSPLPVVDPNTQAITGGIRKFVNDLPGLGAGAANNIGQYLVVGQPDTTSFPGSDYYEIAVVEYLEQMHSDLPATRLRGYVQLGAGPITGTVGLTYLDGTPILKNGVQVMAVDKPHYLGPVIVAQRDRPVRIKFSNLLPPTSAGGNLFIPCDHTYMGAGSGPNGMTAGDYAENRATLHLHGGNTPWISDGTPHQWTTPATENTPYPKGVAVQNVPDMPPAGPGELTFFYTNQQSARLMFYHDHAYGITRLNVYAGEAAGYLIQDPVEQGLVAAGTIPAEEIPLVIQDKSFVPDNTLPFTNKAGSFPSQLQAQDPTWDLAKYGGFGQLWFPHVYMPNQDPSSTMGATAMGRWDYGPWFWPPFTGITYPPIPNPYYDPTNAPWEGAYIPAIPNPTGVPEGFMDTPVVNGTVYPFKKVGQKAYRFRILNACNDRNLNLQLYFAKSNAVMWDPNSGALLDANAGEVNMVPAVAGGAGTAGYPIDITDGRDGGVPDSGTAGPMMIQIGTEGGLLPAPAILPNTPVGFDYNRRSITVLNVTTKTLFLGPAERADVIIDFSGVPDGSKLIMYNDAPAPVPAFDPRFDYYTGDPDQTDTGGAPSTLPGYGPNTRTILQFQVDSTLGVATGPFDLAALQNALPLAFAASQPAPIVPQSAYNAAFSTTFAADQYPYNQQWVRISDTSMNFTNGLLGLQGLTLTNPGSGYNSVPKVSIAAPTGPNGVAATASAKLTPTGLASIQVTAGGSGFVSVPKVVITPVDGLGSGANATAVMSPTGVGAIRVTASGSKYTSATVTIGAPNITGGVQAKATATISLGKITAITVTVPGSGYTAEPKVTITGTGTGAAATATLQPTSVASVTVTSAGSGYTQPPQISFQGGTGTGALATSLLVPTSVAGLVLTNIGYGFTTAPLVTIDPPPAGVTATATASLMVKSFRLLPKAIQELFTLDYGRMNAILGVEIPNTTGTNQTTIPYGYIDPSTEIVGEYNPAIPLIQQGGQGDNTQIWKITHNGVDTHSIHFHLFDVQLINRVGWDGMVKPPDPNELGWKDTVRMNPLEDCIVAVRPHGQVLPFDLPLSMRTFDTTMAVGSTMGFTDVDVTGQPITVQNKMANFGYEYVWHCHLLGHEENDMMRPVIFATSPKAPNLVSAVPSVSGKTHLVTLTWTAGSKNTSGFTIQRINGTGTWTTLGAVPAGQLTYQDTTVIKGSVYTYRVVAVNTVGDTTIYPTPAVGYPNVTKSSPPSNTIQVTAL